MSVRGIFMESFSFRRFHPRGLSQFELFMRFVGVFGGDGLENVRRKMSRPASDLLISCPLNDILALRFERRGVPRDFFGHGRYDSPKNWRPYPINRGPRRQ